MFHALKAIPMNKEENVERQEREGRYRESQDDVSIIRREVNKLTGVIGEMKSTVASLETSIRGNDMGTEGFAKQIKDMSSKMENFEDIAYKISDRVKDLEDKEKFKEKAWRIVFLVVGTIAGTWIKTIIDRLIPLKK
jgi:chromosome segregation ATPase